METILVVAILGAIATYGLLKLLIELRQYGTKHEFGVEFLEKLKGYWDSAGENTETYGWLIHRSNKMQGQMGGYGIVHNYKPPYQNFMVSNYPIILNMLPDLRRALEDELLARNLAHQYMSALQESLVRHLGAIEDEQEKVVRELRNPFKWFREGVRDLIALPAYILGWLGIINEATARRWASSILFSAVSGLVALAGFVSAIVTIVVGWNDFVEIVRRFLS